MEENTELAGASTMYDDWEVEGVKDAGVERGIESAASAVRTGCCTV